MMCAAGKEEAKVVHMSNGRFGVIFWSRVGGKSTLWEAKKFQILNI